MEVETQSHKNGNETFLFDQPRGQTKLKVHNNDKTLTIPSSSNFHEVKLDRTLMFCYYLVEFDEKLSSCDTQRSSGSERERWFQNIAYCSPISSLINS